MKSKDKITTINDTIDSSKDIKNARKILNLRMILFTLPVMMLTVLASYLSMIISSNGVLVRNIFIASSVDLFISLCEISAYAVFLAFIIYSVLKLNSFLVPYIIFVTVSALRYFLVSFITGLVYNSISFDDFLSAWIALALDLLIVGIMTLIAFLISKRPAKDNTKPKKSTKIPFPDFSQAIYKSILISGIIWASVKIILRIIYDVKSISLFGAPSAKGIVWMIIYYLFDILICPFFCLIAITIIKNIEKRLTKTM